MTVRLFSPRRALLRLGSRCLVAHVRQPDWRAVVERTLDLLMIDREPTANGVKLAGGRGAITWRGTRMWTVIDLDLSGYPEKKRSLVAAGLVKACRYPQPEVTHAERDGDR